MAHCLNCEQESMLISKNLSLCARCIKEHFDKVLPRVHR
jgi:hypothetical protein